MEMQTKFEGRILKQISYEEAKARKLKEVGRCFATDLNHALYLMDKYCSEKEKVKYYLIELKIENTNPKIRLPTLQSSMMIFKFYKDKK